MRLNVNQANVNKILLTLVFLLSYLQYFFEMNIQILLIPISVLLLIGYVTIIFSPKDILRKIIKKTFETHRSLKMVTVVDDDIDPNNAEAVEYAMATRFQADRDLVIIKNVRGSSLDPSSDQKKLKTAKLGIDATKPLSKRKEGFEIAKIPKQDKIFLKDYL